MTEPKVVHAHQWDDDEGWGHLVRTDGGYYQGAEREEHEDRRYDLVDKIPLDVARELARLAARVEELESLEYRECRNAALEEACIAIQEACGACDGKGGVVVGVHEVSQEMASDAGMPEMAGYGFQEEVEQCEYCGRPIAAIRALKEKP